MLSQLLQFQWIIAPVLAVPAAILLGMRRPTGAIIVSGVGALLAIAFKWYSSATNPTADFTPNGNIVDSVVAQAGGVLLLGGWALALAHAAQARRWRWISVLIFAGYLSYSIILFAELTRANPCAFSPSNDLNSIACPPPNQLRLLLLALGEAVGPAIILIYGLRAPGRRERQAPDGLVVSSLRGGTAADERAV